MARNKKRTARKIVINENKPVPQGFLLVPKKYDPPGPPSMEGPVLLSDAEREFVEARFGPPTMTRYGLLSYADDSASSVGGSNAVSRGDPSQGTTGSNQGGSNTGATAGGSRSTGAAGMSGGPSAGGGGGRSPGSSSSQGAGGTSGGPSGQGGPAGGGDPGSGSSGSGSARSGAAGMNAGRPGGGSTTGSSGSMASRGGVNQGRSTTGSSGSMASRGGVTADRGGGTQPGSTTGGGQPSSRTPGGGAQPASGALGQMARERAPSTRTPGGGQQPLGALGQLAGPPRAPGSAAGLLSATRTPKSINDRIAPEQGRGPLGPGGEPTGFDPTRPVGMPPSSTSNFDPLSGIRSPAQKAEDRFIEQLGYQEVPEAMKPGVVNPFNTVFAGGVPKFGKAPAQSLDPVTPTDMTLQALVDWQRANKYKDPSFSKLQSPAVGIGQMKPGTIEMAANELGYDMNTTTFSPEVQRNLNLVTGDMLGVDAGTWSSLRGKPAATRELQSAFNEAQPAARSVGGSISNYSGVTANVNDPVATAGLDLPRGNLQTPSVPGAFGTVPGESPFADQPRQFGDPLPAENTVRVNPAASPPAKDQSRLATDPNYNPSQGTYNPSTGRVDYSPEQQAQIDRGNRLLGNTLADVPTQLPDLPALGAPKVQDRIPPAYDADLQYLNDPAPARHAVDIADALIASRRAPPTRTVTGDPREEQMQEQRLLGPPPAPPGLPPRSTTGILSPPTRGPIPGFTPTPPANIGDLQRRQVTDPQMLNTMTEMVNRPIEEELAEITRQAKLGQKIPVPREKPETVQPYEPVDTTSRVPSTDVTPSDISYPDERFERPKVSPTEVSPEIPVNVTVKNNVTKQYGPEMAEEILTTVAAVKRAMGFGQRGSNRRGRGIGQLVYAPKKRKYSPVPANAPRLEA